MDGDSHLQELVCQRPGLVGDGVGVHQDLIHGVQPDIFQHRFGIGYDRNSADLLPAGGVLIQQHNAHDMEGLVLHVIELAQASFNVASSGKDQKLAEFFTLLQAFPDPSL